MRGQMSKDVLFNLSHQREARLEAALRRTTFLLSSVPLAVSVPKDIAEKIAKEVKESQELLRGAE